MSTKQPVICALETRRLSLAGKRRERPLLIKESGRLSGGFGTSLEGLIVQKLE